MIGLEVAKTEVYENRIRTQILTPVFYFFVKRLIIALKNSKSIALSIAEDELKKADADVSGRLKRGFDVEVKQEITEKTARIYYRLLNYATAKEATYKGKSYGPYDVPYWNVLDTGRGVGKKKPPSGYILDWLKKKGITPPNPRREISGALNREKELERYAYIIAKKISTSGIKSRPEIFDNITDRLLVTLKTLTDDVLGAI